MTESERHDGPKTYPASKARQGEIVLRTRGRRMIFFGGLIGFVLLAVLFRLFVFV